MTFPVSLILQTAMRSAPVLKTSESRRSKNNQNLDLPKIDLKQERPKYSFGWTDYREIFKK